MRTVHHTRINTAENACIMDLIRNTMRRMNVKDRATLYAGIAFEVLRFGWRLSLFPFHAAAAIWRDLLKDAHTPSDGRRRDAAGRGITNSHADSSRSAHPSRPREIRIAESSARGSEGAEVGCGSVCN